MTRDSPVVIYDGACRFCIRQAARLARLTGGRVRLESFREPGVLERYPGLDLAACEQALQLVEPDGHIAAGADAVARALALRPLFRPVTWLYRLPILRQLVDALYRVVARNRFRLPGDTCADEACGVHAPREPPSRALVRNLFLRLLGVVFLIAFVSLLAQITLLVGERGLLPAEAYFRIVPWQAAPSLFRLDASDAVLRTTAVAGVLLSLLLVSGMAPRWCLIALWALYLSFVHAGQDFFSFQWDNLLLETAFFAVLVAPPGLRPRQAPPPHPVAVFLMLWLLFRLHVESGLAKLLLGDPTWRDLTAMATYYETAPLPTPLAWWAHQLPLWAHRLSGAYVYAAELVFPLLMWAAAPVRVLVFVALVGMQVVIALTANYGFFNLNSIVLALWILDDRQLGRASGSLGVEAAARPARASSRVQNATFLLAAVVLVPLSIVPFLRFLPLAGLEREVRPVQRTLNALRSINAYHLFAQMTRERREAVIEGSDDGSAWRPYEFRYKAGDPHRPPPFVAPHQPRVDFQLWFLLLGRPTARYFETLLTRLLTEPALVRPLFSQARYPADPPRHLRVAYYRYRFTDRVTGATTHAWWERDLLGYSRVLDGAAYGRAPAP
jgi:predicted DCC family thiol-disulfide oxidoreductase YuxK